jgi:glyoxylase-like metal-dependent hydrolase (beta-lactamase superfamily II)
LWLVDEDVEVAPGVRTVAMPGHTDHHRGVRIDLGDRVILYPADLVPTAAHARLAWIMSYDLDPRTTYVEKERWLERAGREGWWIVFVHDPEVAVARAEPAAHGQGCGLDVILSADRGEGGSTAAARSADPPVGREVPAPHSNTRTEPT